MNRRLQAPSSPTSRPGSRHRAREVKRETRKQRRRSTSRRIVLLAVLMVTLGMFTICLLLTVFPARFLPREGGRTNFLLLGIDRREGTGWAYRTDTIIVVTLKPESGAGAMLSIPRDLQIAIPGHGENRINTANVYGYDKGNPGSGPALLAATIQAGFGIPVDGYLMADFQAFEAIVDTLDGIDIDVPKLLHDTRYPDPRPGDPYAYKTIHFEPGRQHMDGKRALEYARSRMSTTDFDRAERQHMVLLAIRERALSLSAIPRWPLLAAAVVKGIKTNMNPGQLLTLAFFGAQMDASDLTHVVLEPPLVVGHRRADGAAVQLPNWDLINPLIAEVFGPSASR